LERGADTFRSLVKEHQAEWRDIERLRVDALAAYQDETFRPEDASDSWNAKEGLNHAAKLFNMYNTSANALMVAQEGERRAHGFDYRDQKKAAKEEGKDYARQADALREMMEAIEVLAGGKIIDGEFYEHKDEPSEGAHEADGQGEGEDPQPAQSGPLDAAHLAPHGAL